MHRPRTAIVVAAAALSVVGLMALPSYAAPIESPSPDSPSLDIDPGMLTAMRRDLRLTDDQIADRLVTEAAAPVIEKRLRSSLGAAFAGAWIPSGKSRLTVAVTTAAAAEKARAEGAEAKIVARGERDLAADRQKLDKRAKQAAKGIYGWYADVATNSIVVRAKPGAEAAARKFAADSGAGAVRVEALAEQPKPMYDIR
ncbi:S1 family peptidase, partial [Actinoplanes sp. NPDC051633]|uniref:S1 family peptidase n=1 Tax=Actinoplanes sp. NPDC051633 TaxID=3155670 RepID=UPI0034270D8E